MLNTVEEIFGGMLDIQERTIHIYTGAYGMEMVSQTFAISNATDYIEWALETNNIPKDTGESLLAMLKSPDKENANLALLALEQMTHEYSI
jgi:hypothetical protein